MDRRAALPRCIALVDALPVHAQLSLRSRWLIFFTSPLLLNLRLRPSFVQSQRHIQVLLSTVTTKLSCCTVHTYPMPERCPVVCPLPPFLPPCVALSYRPAASPFRAPQRPPWARASSGDIVRHAGRSTRYGRRMLPKAAGKTSLWGFWCPDPPGAGGETASGCSSDFSFNFNGHCSKISRHSFIG